MATISNTPKNRSSPGGFNPDSGMIYEQIEKDNIAQYAVKTIKNPNIKLMPHLEMGPHVVYFPLSPCPWVSPPEPEPYGTFQEFWQELRQFIYEHLDLETDVLYDILVAWVIASWTPERWESVPYLHFHGSSNSGKTRGLDILNLVSYRSIESPSVSSSSIYRALNAWHPTFLLDEFEMYEKMKEQKAEVIGVLNAGYKKGQHVLRTDKVQDGELTLKAFSCFGFKAIASIQELPGAMPSRTIRIPMSRSIRPIKRIIDKEQARKLRAYLLFYRFENYNAPVPTGNPIDLPDGRLIELYTPLCFVSTKEIESKILEYALSQFKETITMERLTNEAKVFVTVLELLGEIDTDKILQETIRNRINSELPEKEMMSKQRVASLLRRLGFESEAGSKAEGRLMKVKVYANVIERRKNRYVLPEEMATVDLLIEKLRELEKKKMVEVRTLFDTNIISNNTLGTVSTVSTVSLGGTPFKQEPSPTPPMYTDPTVPNVPNVPTVPTTCADCYGVLGDSTAHNSDNKPICRMCERIMLALREGRDV